MSVRLRQVALVASDLRRARAVLEEHAGLGEPFSDPGVGEFGLDNAVYEAGSDFVEVVSPKAPGAAAGRYLERHGDGGYMAIFQVGGNDDLAALRARLPALGVRVVWQADLPDIAGTHLHPKDVPGAIVSVDAATPPESWRWAGPRWTGGAPSDRRAGGISEIVVGVDDCEGVAARWQEVVGCPLDPMPSGQRVRFVEGGPGIVEVTVELGWRVEVRLGSVMVRIV